MPLNTPRNGRGSESRHALKQRGHDLYETPPEATRALVRWAGDSIPQRVWEPACGPGAIVRVLREAGREVIATDLVDYACPEATSGVDFLMETRAPAGANCIVTNPPYALADPFVRHALSLCPDVFMLLRLAYLEGAKRRDLHTRYLHRVYLGVERLPMMHRAGWDGPQRSNAGRAFAWFHFRADGQTAGHQIQFLSWRGE